MTTLIVLRILHVLTGILWAGSVVFVTLYLFPALRQAGPGAAGPVMAGLVRRGMMTAMPLLALTTVLSGLGLIWVASNGEIAAYARSSSGQMFTTAGGLAIIAFVIGIAVSRPAAMRAGRLTAQLAMLSDPAEREALGARIAALQRRNTLGLNVVAILVLLASMGMAIARYL